MQVPFLDLYLWIRDKARALRSPGTAESSPPPRLTIAVAKPETERLSKTVLPNMIRKVGPPNPLNVAAGVVSPPKVSLEPTSRARSSLSPAPVRMRRSPADVALSGEPKTERSITIRLRDILDRLPVGYVKSPDTFDCERNILLRASEIEKGMSEGKPTVSLASIYQQAPEMFVHSPAADDQTLVALPFETVLTQFMGFQVRPDQLRDEIVPQVETPILQVTLEDTERFGTTIEPLQTSPLPPVRVEPATAKSIADAQPEASVRETIKPRALRPTISLIDSPSAKREAPPRTPAAPVPRPKVPVDLPPNGTGEPASEIVPALSGPPVPTISPPAMPVVSPRVAFRVTAPSEDIRPKFIRIPGSEPRDEAAGKPVGTKEAAPKIALSLTAVLHELPAFQLNGSPAGVPEDVRVELPLSLIEPQLASGRVVVSPTLLQKAIPENYRSLLKIDPVETPVALPLQEVLKNLPTGALRMRPDQEEIELGETFETPFSIRAAEDAKRFQSGTKAPAESAEDTGKPVEEPAKPTEAALEEVADAAKPAEQPEKVVEQPAAPVAAAEKSEPQRKEQLDDKLLLARANALPGVAACAVLFTDGLALAGKLPAELSADGLCAMLPSVLEKIDKHLIETKLGALNAVTLHTGKAPLMFVQRGNICLAVLHAESELPAASRDQLVSMIEQLSHTYSEQHPAHVDH
jgi:predicted regulator of Ras-like GTPase activity (Roadblock/LC7/MglB family)